MKVKATALLHAVTGWLYLSRRRIATAGVVVVTMMVAFHVVFGANGVFVYAHKRSEYRELDGELKRLQEENERLNQSIKALRTDPRTIEKEAREQLKYARPGEVVYALPQQPTAQPNSHSAQKK